MRVASLIYTIYAMELAVLAQIIIILSFNAVNSRIKKYGPQYQLLTPYHVAFCFKTQNITQCNVGES